MYWFARGYRTRLGVNGGYDNHSFNIAYGSVPNLWIDNTNLGQISIVSDARIKHEVQCDAASDRTGHADAPSHLPVQ